MQPNAFDNAATKNDVRIFSHPDIVVQIACHFSQEAEDKLFAYTHPGK
jgi:hypothetical protein